MLRNIGPLEISLILLLAILVFGAGRVGQIGGALGRSIREFKQELRKPDDGKEAEVDETAEKTPESKG